MVGGRSPSTLPRFAALLPAVLLFGATGVGQAQQQQVEMAATVDTTIDGDAIASPVFAPAEDGVFAEAFDAFETPVAPELPGHAVDITTIEPAAPAAQSLGDGVASYYGRRFHGRRTANGERFDMNQLTAAHRTLPFGSRVRVTNPRTGRSVVVRINDRGPFVRGRHIDLSRRAAEEIGIIRRGHADVRLELLLD